MADYRGLMIGDNGGSDGQENDGGGNYNGRQNGEGQYQFEASQDGGNDSQDGGGVQGGGAGTASIDISQVASIEELQDIAEGLPHFANAANRALHARIQEVKRQIGAASGQSLENSERLQVMSEHLRNVRQEVNHAQELLTARQKEVKTEEHLKTLTERAVGRMRQEISTLEKRADAVADQISTVQAGIYRGSERLEGYRSTMQMAQGELEKWAAAQREKEDDALALDKFTRADELKIRELSRELERLTALGQERRKELEKEVTETKTRQVELDKMAADFRALHAERQSLIRQWKESLDAVAARDQEIAKQAERFAGAKAAVAARKMRVREQEGQLEQLQAGNQEAESAVYVRERQVGEARDALRQLQDRVTSFKEEVELLKTNVAAAASELANKKQQITTSKNSLEEKKQQVEAARQRAEAMKEQLAAAEALAADTEAALADKEAYMEREQARVEAAERRLALLKEQLYRATEAVKTLKTEEATIRNEIVGAKRTSKNLSDKIKELDLAAQAQQEHVYAAEFRIQQMERKLATVTGEVSEEEKVILTARKDELQAELEEAMALEKALMQQNKAVKEELRTATRHQQSLTQQLQAIQARMDELILQNKTSEEALKGATRDKEEALVAHDMLKLEIRKLRDILSSKADEVFGLENKGAQLAMSIDARKREVEAERVVQRAAAKLAEEERHKLALDLGERQQQITLLKAKYEALVARTRPSGEAGLEGEQKSQAYFILQAAQKREELQREGDELDAAIKKAEREIKALTAALGHLTARNTALREAFHRVDGGSDEAGAVRAMEARAKEASDLLFRRKKELVALQARLEETVAQSALLDEKLNSLRNNTGQLETTARRIDMERSQQLQALQQTKDKTDQAKLRVRSLLLGGGSRASSAGGGSVNLHSYTSPTAEELAFVAQGIRECVSSVLFTLGQLSKEFPQMKPTLGELMDSQGLKMPAKPPPRSAIQPNGAVLGITPAAVSAVGRPGSGAGGGGLSGPQSPTTVTLIGAPNVPAPAVGGAFPASAPRSRQGPDGRPLSGMSISSVRSNGSGGGGGGGGGPSFSPMVPSGGGRGGTAGSRPASGSGGPGPVLTIGGGGGGSGSNGGTPLRPVAGSISSRPSTGTGAGQVPLGNTTIGGGSGSRPASGSGKVIVAGGLGGAGATGGGSRPASGSRPLSGTSNGNGNGNGGRSSLSGSSPMAAAGLSLVGAGLGSSGGGGSRPASGRSVGGAAR